MFIWIFESLGGLLEASWKRLGGFLRIMEVCWRCVGCVLGASWRLLGGFGGVFDMSWNKIEGCP